MGTTYDGEAGYGIKITQEMCEALSTEEKEFDGDIDNFCYTILDDAGLNITATGNAWSGELDYWILLSDPLNNNMDEFIEQLNSLPFNLDIKSYKDLSWVCEIYVG